MEPTKPITNEEELNLLRMTFKDNEVLLKLTRALFYGFSLTEEEKMTLRKVYANAKLRETIRKKVYPIFSNEMPIGTLADYWAGTEQNVLGMARDTIYQSVQNKQKCLEMLEHAFRLLDDPDGEPMDLSYNPGLSVDDPLAIKLLSRNLYIRTIETGLNFIKICAQSKEENKEEVVKKNLKNSNK